MASSTTTQEYRKRQNVPGYMETNVTGKSLSSNNPFRMSILSPGPEDGDYNNDIMINDDIWNVQRSGSVDSGAPRIYGGSTIVQHQSLSDLDVSRSSNPASASVVGSRHISSGGTTTGIGQRRVPSRNSTYRKSTNPFIDFDESASYRTFSQSLEDVTYRPITRPISRDREVVDRLPSFQESPQRNMSSGSAEDRDRVAPRRPSSRTKPDLLEKPTLRDRRANSDSSVMSSRERLKERGDRGERGDREREREHHHKSSSRTHRSHGHHDKHDKHRHRSKDHHKKKDLEPFEGIDVIDKLDVSGFYAPGSFHHDGPFDACNPHRNKNTKKAPVAAFPADGANNSLSSALANRESSVESRIMGRTTTEAYTDFSSWGAGKKKAGSDSFDASAKAEPVHGDTTMGLGSSTFLDGAPASQAAIKESINESNGANGLGRKKSLVQRLRGNSNSNGSAPPRPAPITRTLSPPGAPNYEPISRSSSNPEPRSPTNVKNMPRVTLQDPPASSPSSSGSGIGGGVAPRTYEKTYEVSTAVPKESGFMRRVKSLKVGGRRRS